MVKQFPVATAYGNAVPVQVHPAPDANYWSAGESNVHKLAVTAASPTVWIAHSDATLVLIDVTETVTMLVDGSENAGAGGFPLRGGQQYSLGIPAGASIAFQAVTDDADVTILES